MSEPSTGMMVTSNVRLLRPLGEGGMGSVWVGEHLSLHTQVVVKFMANDLAQSPEALARFSREAAAASQVKSPHVVQMFDHGVTGSGAPYIVMELLEGRDLEQEIRSRSRLDPREVVGILAQLARALGKAHERGIIHRDIKPSNVFLCDDGDGELFVKLLDFGIAKGTRRDGSMGMVGSTTRSGSFIGSPFYMSPEQVIGAKTIDFRTDLWSLGVVAYEALTGDRPFFAETVGGLALKIHRDPLPLPSNANPALGATVDAWFARACAREPDDRFASARELADALAQAVTGASLPWSEMEARVEVASRERPARVHGPWWWLGAMAFVAAVAGVVVPRWIGRPLEAKAALPADPPPPSSPSSFAPVSPVAPPLLVPVAATTTPIAATATPVVATTTPVVATTPMLAPAPVAARPPAPTGRSLASRSLPGQPSPSSPPAAIAPSASAAPAVRPPPGSEDDIK